MAEPIQYSFDLRELAIAMIKKQDIRVGKWLVSFEIAMGTGMFGPTPTETFPGSFMQIKKALLTKADPASPQHFVVDAAEVWTETT